MHKTHFVHRPIFVRNLGENSIDSRWVEREFDEASHEEVEGRKVIVPVVAGGLHIQQIPARVRRRACAIFNQNFEGEYRQLKWSILEYLKMRERAVSQPDNIA
jgi:hypothetical protein